MTPDKKNLLALLREFVAQRPGLIPADYVDAASYRADSRHCTQQLNEALTMLTQIEMRTNITAEVIASRLQPGSRLSLETLPSGALRLDYTAGQCWAMEFRAAVCRLCADLLWSDSFDAFPRISGDERRAHFREWFGRGMAGRWFN
jgi:hypothetical protein